ncbi:MAG: hypothetical protein ACXVID_04905 [Thermoanaerobaculia bacterium]
MPHVTVLGAGLVDSLIARTLADDFESARDRGCDSQLIRRIYEVDPLVCTRCGGAMRIVSFITERPVILKILRHLRTAPGARSPA